MSSGPIDLPDSVRSAIETVIGSSIRHVSPVGGGCISNASRVIAGTGVFFLKWASPPAGATFEAEAEGLKALRGASSGLTVPEVLDVSGAGLDRPGHLLMEWLEEGPKTLASWESLGAGLARLHRGSDEDRYGFDRDNYIGRLPQANGWKSGWVAFFAEQRILPQVALARSSGRWTHQLDRGLNGLLRALPAIIPESPRPSLVHGDLWAGNVLATEKGAPALIDPAVYYGHREVDLAMSELFGGFHRAFYTSYETEWPIEPGYEERRDVYNLYHLINHLNHFGSSYFSQVEGVLRRFSGACR